MGAQPHDQGRVIVPAVYVEGLFRRAPVNDPSVLAPVKLIEKCLGVPEDLGDALELLIDEGLFEYEDDRGQVSGFVYDDINDLKKNADELCGQLKDRPEIEVKPESFEWLERYTPGRARKTSRSSG